MKKTLPVTERLMEKHFPGMGYRLMYRLFPSRKFSGALIESLNLNARGLQT